MEWWTWSRGVDRAGEEVLGQPLAPRGDDRREVRERPSRRQDAARRLGIARDLAEPGDDVRLDLRQARRGGEDADVAVRRSRDQVGDRRVRDASARDVGEVAGPRRVEPLRNDFLEEQVEQLAGRPARLRQRLPQRPRQGRCRRPSLPRAAAAATRCKRGCAPSPPRSGRAAPERKARVFGPVRSSCSRERSILREAAQVLASWTIVQLSPALPLRHTLRALWGS